MQAAQWIIERRCDYHNKEDFLNCYVFSALKYACESWTVNKSLTKRIHAFERWCYGRMLKISWKDRVSNTDIAYDLSTFLQLLPLLTVIVQSPSMQLLAMKLKHTVHQQQTYTHTRGQVYYIVASTAEKNNPTSKMWFLCVHSAEPCWYRTEKPVLTDRHHS